MNHRSRERGCHGWTRGNVPPWQESIGSIGVWLMHIERMARRGSYYSTAGRRSSQEKKQ